MSDTLQAPPVDGATDDLLLSVVYVSDATVEFSEMDLALLLAVSRANNEPHRITGLLLHEDGRFLQALEGPERAVRTTLARIAADPRHTNVRTLEETRITERRFGSWSMGYRAVAGLRSEVGTWFGSPEAIAPSEGSRAADLLERFRER